MINCQENIIKDVVGIDVIKASDCKFPIPFNVSGIKSMPLSAMPKSYYHLGVNVNDNADNNDEVDGDISVKSSNKSSVTGNIFTYDVTAVVVAVSSEPFGMEADLYRQDFHLIICFADGTSKLCYGLPNTSLFNANESFGSNSSISIKIAIQSLNKLISLL